MVYRAGRHRSRRTQAGSACFVVASLLFALSNWATTASAASQAITSAGPLTNIAVSDTLNCSVNHTGDMSGEFYTDTACGTFVAVGGKIYGPSAIPAGENVTTSANYVAFTPVSQSAVTGSGTAADPFKIVTVVDAGTTGVRVTETDTYVVGQETYRTDVLVGSSSEQAVIVYRAGDCFLQDSDTGFGAVDQATGSVSCVGVQMVNGNEVRGTRIEQWRPLSPGSNSMEGVYSDVWAAIATGQAFPNTCRCADTDNIDNGAGLSWSATVPAGGSITRSHLTSFSPAGNQPLTTSKTADAGSVAPGGSDGYTITVTNPNTSQVTLNSISDTLPAGFAYTAGSTTGVATTDPTVNGQTLTWTGSFNVAAGANVTLHFGVTASNTPGTYFNNAGADAGSFSVAPTGDTAQVTVTQSSTTSSSPSSTSSTTPGSSTSSSSTTSTPGGSSTTSTPGGTTTTTAGGTTTTVHATTTTIGGTTTTVQGTTTTSSGGTTTTSGATTTTVATTTTTSAPSSSTSSPSTTVHPTTTTTASSTTTSGPTTTTSPTSTSVPGGAAPTANVSQATVVSGQQTTVFGDGFPGATNLDLNLLSDPVFLASTTSDAAGHYSVVVTIPAGTAPGVHQIVVTGGGKQATTSVTVTAPSGSTLVRTGSNAQLLLRAGGVAIAAGGLLLLLGVGEPLPAGGRRPPRRR